jgi:CBS domain containing-hemolysin-like protein
MITTQIIILIILIALSAFFSGIETALMSISQIKVQALLKQKKRGAEALHRLKQNPHRLIITILIGNNLVNISAASIAAIVFTELFGSSGIGIATGVMTFLILVFGEISPKTLAVQNAEKISLKIARLIEVLSYILYPFVRFFEAIAKLVIKLIGGKKEEKISEEEIETIVSMGAKEGILNKEAAHMIHKVLKFQNIRVSSIMQEDMKIINSDARIKDALDYIIKEQHTKYPVYTHTKNNITGILVVDDVLAYIKSNRLNVKVGKIAGLAFFVPKDKPVDDLLVDFQHRKIHMAIVKEKDIVVGLVTMDDVLEEIVGDIFEKSKRPHVYIKKVGDRMIRADARASVEEINKELHIGIRSKHFVTLAGYIEHKLGRIAKKGDKLRLNRVTIEVDKIKDAHIDRVKIRRK